MLKHIFLHTCLPECIPHLYCEYLYILNASVVTSIPIYAIIFIIEIQCAKVQKCPYLGVPVYSYLYTHMYRYMYIYIYIYLYTHVHIYTYIHTYISTYSNIHPYIHIDVYVRGWAHVYTCIGG